MADYTFKGYDNEVIENKIESILTTKLDMNRFLTADYSLTVNPGMSMVVHTYTGTGTVDDLSRGDGNTNFVDASYTAATYTVGRTQGQAKYYDDDAMNDPTLIDAKVKYLAEGMANSFTAKAIAEFDKTTNSATITDWSFGDVADAIAVYADEKEDEEGLFFLVAQDQVADIRKALNDNLKYVEGYARTGYVGNVCGVPMFFTKAIDSTQGTKGYLATKEAVTAFIKKGMRVEQSRDIDKKENFIVADVYQVVALTDETKCIKLV